MLLDMTETDRAILEIREVLASLKTRLDNLGPRIGEDSLCRVHSKQIEDLHSKMSRWTGGIAVIAFMAGIIIAFLIKLFVK